MRKLTVRQLSYDLTPVAGLSLVGHLLASLDSQFKRIDAAAPVSGVAGIATSDVLRSYLGLLAQGKSDFDAIENFRSDAFYKAALGVSQVPLSPTVRQRLDARASALFEFVPDMIETLLAGQQRFAIMVQGPERPGRDPRQRIKLVLLSSDDQRSTAV